MTAHVGACSTAHNLYLLSKVFEVPIVYFFLPPPACLDQTIAHTGDTIPALLETLFGTLASLRAVDRRLVEIAHRPVEAGASTLAHDAARQVGGWHTHLSRMPEVDCNARLREIANLLQELADLHRADYE